MTTGICFYVDGSLHSMLLTVAIHSLIRNYGGPIHVIYGENITTEFADALRDEPRITAAPAKVMMMGKAPRGCWFLKPYLHLEMPFDVGIMYDCDHVFVREFDVSAFNLVRLRGLVSFVDRRQVSRHKTAAMQNVFSNLDYARHRPVNGGCVGSYGATIREAWIVAMERILRSSSKSIRRHADEHSLSYTIATRGGVIGESRFSEDPGEETIGCHFMREQWRGHPVFEDALESAVQARFLSIHEQAKVSPSPKAD